MTTFDEWSDYLSLTLADRTKNAYQYELKRLEIWLESNITTATTSQLLKYLKYKQENGCGANSIKLIVNALRSYYQYINPDNNPAKKLPIPKSKPKKQRALDRATCLRIFAELWDNTPLGFRDSALLAFMLDTGRRASEVCRLKLIDLDIEKRQYRVIVKGGAEHQGCFGTSCQQVLGTWLQLRKSIASADCNTVFCSLGGNTPGKALTADGLKAIFRSIAKRTGLSAFSPHDMRRSMVVNMLQGGHSDRAIQAQGGWGKLEFVHTYSRMLSPEFLVNENYPMDSVLKS